MSQAEEALVTAYGPIVTVGCDNCGLRYQLEARSMDEARVELAGANWAYVGGRPEYDYCSDCAPRRAVALIGAYKSRLDPDFLKVRS